VLITSAYTASADLENGIEKTQGESWKNIFPCFQPDTTEKLIKNSLI
jgi:hypothetical protein